MSWYSIGCMVQLPRGLRILAADDSVPNRTLLQAYLHALHHRVEAVTNGVEAVEKVREGRYDVVLMDMQMPVMDGYAATRAIREWERSQRREPTPIIALTADALSGARSKCLDAGCTDHVTKPIKMDVLLAAIAEHTRDVAPPAEPERAGTESAILVHADPDLAKLITDFMRAMKARTSTLEQALGARDYATIRTLGHQMHGEGGSFGFDAISDFGADLEHAALQRDDRAMRTTMDALASYVNHAAAIYDRGA